MTTERDYLWCLHCETAFVCPEPSSRRIAGVDVPVTYCPNCGNNLFMDSFPWADIRAGHADRYPAIPLPLVEYPDD